jgi:hypothetical protein
MRGALGLEDGAEDEDDDPEEVWVVGAEEADVPALPDPVAVGLELDGLGPAVCCPLANWA